MVVFFVTQKTAYEMRISDWSADVCSSDLTVLLDMDGTLLDLHYDNHFWMEHLPQRYAELHGVSRAMAELELQPLFERNAGQLQWYCLDFWSAELKLPV